MNTDIDYYASIVKKFYNIKLSEVKAFIESGYSINEYITSQVDNFNAEENQLAYKAFSMRVCVYGMRVGATVPIKKMMSKEFNTIADELDAFFGRSVILRPERMGTEEGEESIKNLKLLL